MEPEKYYNSMIYKVVCKVGVCPNIKCFKIYKKSASINHKNEYMYEKDTLNRKYTHYGEY